MSIQSIDRARKYSEGHCWQYDIRIKNLEDDLKAAGLTKEGTAALRVKDFEFHFVNKADKEKCQEIKQFIERHEWLGKMPMRPTHRFVATYKGHLAGVVVMATPNAFSNLLGKENRDLEKLISRGACISWSPKNLASALIMFSIRWMVKNSGFRFFTAYSDTEARELGTIYQACNFTYLGQNSGGRIEYFDPENPAKGWFSDRQFRKPSQLKRSARAAGINWQREWDHQIPNAIKEILKNQARLHQSRCQKREIRPKHKYVYILGATTAETKRLGVLFETRNPNLKSLPYPKQRGPQADTAAKTFEPMEENLTDQPQNCRPHGQLEDFEFLNVKEVADMLKVSKWTIYKLIELDQTFPAHNIGIKKKFVVNKKELIAWMGSKTRRHSLERQNLPSGQDLLKLKGA